MTDVLADPVDEARRILEGAQALGVPLRAVGGIAVALIAPTVALLDPPRSYHDIDLVAPAGTPSVSRLLTDLGYDADRRFNALNGSERLMFHDPSGRRIDVFIDTLRMCHALPIGPRLSVQAWTLSPADLVLSKLQIVELTERDAQDLVALFADYALADDDAGGISLARIRQVCCGDWGWWRTVDDNLHALSERWLAARSVADPVQAGILGAALARATQLRADLHSCPKSMGWKVRAAIGPRFRWYELPEEPR
jgi:hypothetical protein